MHSVVIARTVVFFASCIMSGMGGFVVGVIVTHRRARRFVEQMELANTRRLRILAEIYEISLSKAARQASRQAETPQ